MKVFHCDHCRQLVFFENVRCLNCDRALAYLPELSDISSLEPAGEDLWCCVQPAAEGRTYRLCGNYSRENICNWAVPAADPHELCASCRLTRVIPDLSQQGNRELWYRLEAAKRRLVYSLLMLGLPVVNRQDDPEHGLAYEFLADTNGSPGPVQTGHLNGVITINIAEAHDAERETRRLALHEPYRTLLGHFRHEVGHYYWMRLIQDSERADACREDFGDERMDYAEALRKRYEQGAPADWQERFISAYASAHPFEDWAETWAHYLHMTDTLETAAVCGLSLKPRRRDEPSLKADPKLLKRGTFDQMIESWFPLTYMLNNLNRGLGLPDGYPFVLSSQVIEKLRFVHETVGAVTP